MSGQYTSSSASNTPTNATEVSTQVDNGDVHSPSFWRERLIEAGLILSMALYYIVGNPNVAIAHAHLPRLNPLLSLPFLLVFAVLCWFRLPIAVALLPLSLPYYLHQKVVFSHYAFSLAEITLGACLVVALLLILLGRWPNGLWRNGLSLSRLYEQLGPLAIPMLIFFIAAAVSVVVAVEHTFALRAFREEVLDPFLYLLLALACLRTRQDVTRLFAALLGSALIVALFGMAQYFTHMLVLESDGIRRVHAVFGSANGIGLFFDYILPIGFALVLARVCWRQRMLAIVVCLPLIYVLYLTDSRGAWVAIAVAFLFVAALSLQNRRFLFVGGVLVLIALAVALFLYHVRIINFFVEGHTSVHGVSTVTRRIYLWGSALRMIRNSPWLGYGMDNWLCHYSKNNICQVPSFHYWILKDPVTGKPTGLLDEPNLSHPHNIFLHVWVSMGIFGLLAFVAILVLFYALVAQTLKQIHVMRTGESQQLRWMTIGIAGAMLAALAQGLVDSSFLEQDLAFCFWTLVASLLILRTLSGVNLRSWKLFKRQITTEV